MTTQNQSSSRHETNTEQRPPIVLTTEDREKLSALLEKPTASAHFRAAEFLREEIERADIATGDVAPTAVVRMGSDVKFLNHEDGRVHRARIVFPEEARGPQYISILSSVGSALIGLGPGQSIRWTERRRKQCLSVLEVHAEAGARPTVQRRRR